VFYRGWYVVKDKERSSWPYYILFSICICLVLPFTAVWVCLGHVMWFESFKAKSVGIWARSVSLALFLSSFSLGSEG
jgi:hypothetical protein